MVLLTKKCPKALWWRNPDVQFFQTFRTRPRCSRPSISKFSSLRRGWDVLFLNSQDRDDTKKFRKNVLRPPRDWDVEYQDCIPAVLRLERYDGAGAVCVLVVRRDAAAVSVNSEVRRLRRCVTDAQAKYDALTQVRLSAYYC